MIGFGQLNFKTYVPDNNFENYLESNGMGDGILLNDSINRFSIEMLISLDVNGQNISDLTGIQDFTALKVLNCYDNQITTLDLSQNIYLDYLDCEENNITNLNVNQNTDLDFLNCNLNDLIDLDISDNMILTELRCAQNNLTSVDLSNNPNLTWLDLGHNDIAIVDLSNNTALTVIGCSQNNLTSLDLSSNTALTFLSCGYNQLSVLDLSSNYLLETLQCQNNQLANLDVRNGNNMSMTSWINFIVINNPNLNCINVDDSIWSADNWSGTITLPDGTITNQIDPQHYFSANCSGATSVFETTLFNVRYLNKVVDLHAKATVPRRNELLFFLYDDGTVEKKIILE